MNRIFTLLLLIIGVNSFGQSFNNEWIKYPQTYYKFKIVNKGLYRIPKSALDAAGIGNTDVRYFELWKHGQKIALHPSTSAGALGSNGYLEFWGEGNDGKVDKLLYRTSAHQHTDESSLFTDTAVYFLSVNTDQSGLMYTNPGNDVAGNILPPEPYFMHKAATYYRDRINPGFAGVAGQYVYSSSYDRGEFWSSNFVRPGTALVTSHSGLPVYTGGPDASLKYGSMGDALNARTLKISVNGTVMEDAAMDFFSDLNTSFTVPIAMISSGAFSMKFENTSLVSTDRLVMSHFELTYPRLFDFSNQTNFSFSLPASGAKYLEITNFNYGSTSPVLLNLTNGQRITGDVSTPGTVRFVMGAGGIREFVLVSMEPSNISTVNGLEAKTFARFDQTANQGNYLIITNKVLFNGTNGNNPIEQYRQYRSSTDGGGYNVSVVDIDELVDQFAFGIKKHPLSIKNFLKYARANFADAPKFVFIIGRGVAYNEYRTRESDPIANQLDLVPSFGSPASDNLLSSADVQSPVAVTPIGRLSVVHAKEVEDYIEKIKEYENTQRNSSNTLAGREWMKNVVHVTGSSDKFLGTILCNYMGTYQQVIQDTMFGAKVSSFCKASTNAIETINDKKISTLFSEGISMLTYFGHSSTTTLEFNLDNPQNYNNQGKYPIFFVNGCNAGNFFTYSPTRLLTNETLSEKFVLAKQRGSIAFVASTHYGVVNFLNTYLTSLYGILADGDYGKSLGETTRDALNKMMTVYGPNDYYARLHAEEMAIHGDPAIVFNEQSKTDYVVEEPQVKINPTFISVAENSFRVKARVVNIGKSTADSVYLNIKRQLPDGSVQDVLHKKIPGIRYADSVTVDIPIDGSRDKGSNIITVTIDPDNAITEISDQNNVAAKEVLIYENEARTVFPYEYSIVNDPAQKLYASTADPLTITRDYIFEVDTTAAFNSPSKTSKTITSPGGLMDVEAGLSYQDSTVYYWRVAPVPTSGSTHVWNSSSFIYINGDKTGFNQSHYNQQTRITSDRLNLGNDRKWKFNEVHNNLYIRLGTWGVSATQEAQMNISINSASAYMNNTCNFSALAFVVFDPVTFKPWQNQIVPATGRGLYNSERNDCYKGRLHNFEFKYTSAAERKNAMDFMDSIVPDGYYVLVRAFVRDPAESPTLPQAFIDDWKADTTLYGSNQSLYHSLYGQGFTGLDSFYRVRPWIFVYKKNKQQEYFPKSAIARGTFDNISLSVECATADTLGYQTSPMFGPAKEWKDIVWRGRSDEASSTDNPTISVIGVDRNKTETVLFQLDRNQQNFDISSVSAVQYPFMKLKMRNIDSVSLTPYQLDYWRIHYVEVPEGAIAPNASFRFKDTLEIGEPLNFEVAFKNVSKINFDSLAVRLKVLDNNNVENLFELPRFKPLVVGDTVMLRYNIDTRDFSNSNTMNLQFNPDNDQLEQSFHNNFIFKNFYVKTDQTSPLLDVTFDGVHILNKDLVSAKPHIQIRIKDNAKFLLLNDTALSSVQVRYPDGTVRTHHFDNDTLRFTPATSGSDNSAVVDFFPHFTTQYNAGGDEYELIVNGKDKSGNYSGESDMRIAFTVITKPMISNMLNYPNPFSTSTAFVFTLTGSEVPQNMKVQILTVTGKIVREITKDELGPIRIGRNITEFKWDGTDQFGQKVGNGVYLYRFVTSLDGRKMEKYKAPGDNTDRFFNNGYGKMYLMR